MKGVILGVNPSASIVDISHDVQPQQILDGAFIIGTSHRYFPEGTIHVVVVDPGVGTDRRAVLLVTPVAFFLAPDNGLLSWIIREGSDIEEAHKSARVAVPASYRAYSLTNPKFWMHPVSSTFHGRDIFAPVAAHISLGVLPREMGQEISELTYVSDPLPGWIKDELIGHVVHVDRFGNLVTNIHSTRLDTIGQISMEVKGRCVTGISRSYAEREGLMGIIGSYGFLEFSVRDGSAAQELEAVVGDTVRVKHA